MVYPYIINKNGVWFPAGVDVPETTASSVDVKTETKFNYTKRDILRMSLSDLQKLASEYGIKGNTGVGLKNQFVEKFNL